MEWLREVESCRSLGGKSALVRIYMYLACVIAEKQYA